MNNRLSKQLSPLNVWSLALGCIIGWGAFVMPGSKFLPNGGPVGSAIALLLAAMAMIVISFNYAYLVKSFPIAGGEFIFTKKLLGNAHAFICAWFLCLSYLAIVSLNANALALVLRNIMQWLGFTQMSIAGFHFAGNTVNLFEVCAAMGVLIVFAALSIKGAKFAGSFQTILVCLLLAGFLLLLVASLVTHSLTWQNLQPGFCPGRTKLSCILSVLAIAPWAFVGFDTIPQSAEEFRFSPSFSRLIMFIAILFGALVYIILIAVTASSVPSEYNSWAEYICNRNIADGVQTIPTFRSAQLLLGNWGLALLSVSVVAACISGVIGFYMASSRLLYSMSREGILPSVFSKIGQRHNTPVVAILFVMALTLFTPLLGEKALGWIVDVSSLGAAIGYGYTSFAALKMAVSEKRKGIIISGVFGILMAIAFAALLLVPIREVGCSLSYESYICLIGWIVMGSFLYAFSKGKLR